MTILLVLFVLIFLPFLMCFIQSVVDDELNENLIYENNL